MAVVKVTLYPQFYYNKYKEKCYNDPYNQDLINRRDELIKLQQESILSANEEKQSIKSLVSEGIEKELSALKDLIDSYNEAADSQKNMYADN